ncbi:hypothetical protein SALBM135S_04629 [Streptomyces alboniger]
MLQVSDLEYEQTPPPPAHDPGVYEPEPLPDDTGQYGVYHDGRTPRRPRATPTRARTTPTTPRPSPVTTSRATSSRRTRSARAGSSNSSMPRTPTRTSADRVTTRGRATTPTAGSSSTPRTAATPTAGSARATTRPRPAASGCPSSAPPTRSTAASSRRSSPTRTDTAKVTAAPATTRTRTNSSTATEAPAPLRFRPERRPALRAAEPRPLDDQPGDHRPRHARVGQPAARMRPATDGEEAGHAGAVGRVQEPAAARGESGRRHRSAVGARGRRHVGGRTHLVPQQAAAQAGDGGPGVVDHPLHLGRGDLETRGHRHREGHRLVRVVRHEAGVGGAQHRDGAGGGEPGTLSEEVVQLGTAVRRVHHRAVRGGLGAAAGQGQQDRQAARRPGAPRNVTLRPHVRAAGHHRGQRGGRDAREHEVRLRRRAVRQLHARRTAVLLHDPRHRRAEHELDPPGQAPLVQRTGQRAHAAPHRPDAEGLLHVRQDGRARRGRARVEAVREGEVFEERHQTGVAAQLPRADPRASVPARRLRRSEPLVGTAAGYGSRSPSTCQSANRGSSSSGLRWWSRSRARGSGTSPSGRRLRRRAPRRGRRRRPRAMRSGRSVSVPSAKTCRAAGSTWESSTHCLQRFLAGLDEHVAVHGGELRQSRPRVEGEAVPLEAAERAAVRLPAFVHHHPVARDGEPGGGRHRARPGADHHNPCHARDFIGRHRQRRPSPGISRAAAPSGRRTASPRGAAPCAAGTGGCGRRGGRGGEDRAAGARPRQRPRPPGGTSRRR